MTQTRRGEVGGGLTTPADRRKAHRGENVCIMVSVCGALAEAVVIRSELDNVSVSTLVRRALAEWARRARVHLTPCGWTSPSRGARCRSRCGSYVAAVIPPQWARVLHGTATMRRTNVAALVRRAVAEYVGRPDLAVSKRAALRLVERLRSLAPHEDDLDGA
ncbi:MAG: hypothetical protein Q8Q14_00600 [Gemmatimonadales bacterium]|nr:hypothetical protein [Gemmatimonadales bacterium]